MESLKHLFFSSYETFQENDELRLKIVSSSYWPDACSPIETSFHLINTIKNLNSPSPIVVHDHTGGYRAGKFYRSIFCINRDFLLGTFCALYTMKEQIEHEGILNVYELAKFYHIKRPGIWRNSVRKRLLCIVISSLFCLQDDLLFLYRCAEILIREYKS